MVQGATISSVSESSGDGDLYTSYLKKVGAIHDSKGNTISDKKLLAVVSFA